jgi:hypothetical protein
MWAPRNPGALALRSWGEAVSQTEDPGRLRTPRCPPHKASCNQSRSSREICCLLPSQCIRQSALDDYCVGLQWPVSGNLHRQPHRQTLASHPLPQSTGRQTCEREDTGLTVRNIFRPASTPLPSAWHGELTKAERRMPVGSRGFPAISHTSIRHDRHVLSHVAVCH